VVNRAGAAALEALFPQHCALCGLRAPGPHPLCAGCAADLPRNDPCCSRCALPLPRGGAACGRCQGGPPPFARSVAPWLYEECLAHLIGRWKYAGERRLTPLLAQLWLAAAPATEPVDALVPVPLHWRRRLQRGFNQSEALARQLLAHGVQARLAPRLLRRRRATAPQQGLDAARRQANLRGAFAVTEPCEDLRLAVVDDVMTTGTTAAAAARALLAAGAARVDIWCLARTAAPGQ